MKFDENINIDEIFNRSLETYYGIQVSVQPPHTAKILRRQMYHARNKHRAKGISKFDQLSFVVKSNHEIWIVNRDALPQRNPPIHAEIKPLCQSDMPDTINARGNSKVGLMFRHLFE